MPPMSQCANAVSNCWSVGRKSLLLLIEHPFMGETDSNLILIDLLLGQPDWDCPDNGLCCFDGCANTCLGKI